MCNNTNFSKQILEVIKKVKIMTGWILRTFKSRDKNCMLTLWKSLVLPKMEYCSQLWAPIKKGDIQNLEQLQQWSFIRKLMVSIRIIIGTC